MDYNILKNKLLKFYIKEKKSYYFIYKNIPLWVDSIDNCITVIIEYNTNIHNIVKLIRNLYVAFKSYSIDIKIDINAGFNDDDTIIIDYSLFYQISSILKQIKFSPRRHLYIDCENYSLFITNNNYNIRAHFNIHPFQLFISLDSKHIYTFDGLLSITIHDNHVYISFQKPIIFKLSINNYDQDIYLSLTSQKLSFNNVRLNKIIHFSHPNEINIQKYTTNTHKIYIIPGIKVNISNQFITRYPDEHLQLTNFSNNIILFMHHKATIIQKYWRKAISDPSYILCKNRIHYEFNSLLHI